ncbi:hypothetical protein ABPG72_016563 [Tetrahymena utriculariae]
MNFYSLYGSNQEYSLNILELNSTKFLFLRHFPQDKLLYYLPQCEVGENEEETIDELKKKVKIDEETRLFVSNQSYNVSKNNNLMEIEHQEENKKSPYYTKIKDKHYIKGAMKFDLTFLNNIDQNSIDFILITSIDDIFLLPFLFQQNKLKAKVYATVPVAQIGQHVLQEYYKLVQNRNRNIDVSSSSEHKNGQYFQDSQNSYFQESEFLDLFETQYDLEINQWADIFSYEDIQNALGKITTMNFGQKLQLEGVDTIIEPISSGYSIGSCVWILEYHSNRLAVFNNACKHSIRHTLNLDQTSKLKDSLDFLFVTPFLNTSKELTALTKQFNTSYLSEAYLIKFYQLAQQLLQQKQNLIIPIRDGGIILDLLDILEKKLASFIRHLYIICESALPYIHFGNSNVEFLNEILQKKIFCENPENPFSAYDQFVQKNQNINILPDFIAFQQLSKSQPLQSLIVNRTPSIFFVVDSSLRLGNTMQLLKLINESIPNQEEFSSSILLVDPYMQSPHVVAPILGLFRNQIFYTPLDNRMHVQEFCEYVKQINPKNLIYPRKYQDIQIFLEQQREQSGQRILTSVYGNDEAISMNLYQHEQSALTINKNELKNIKFSKFERIPFLPQIGQIRGILNSETGQISTRISISNQMEFDDKLIEENKQIIILRYKNLIQRNQGYMNLQNFIIQEMNQLGYQQTSISTNNEGLKIYLKNQTTNDIAYVEHEKEKTSVFCSNKENTQSILNFIKSKINIVELK